MKHFNKIIIAISCFFMSCIMLESEDFQLSHDCKDFQKELIDSLNRLRIDGVHYIAIDEEQCLLTVKYEKEKVKTDFFLHYLADRKYDLQPELEVIEAPEDEGEDYILEFE